jgi:hypothetical protein
MEGRREKYLASQPMKAHAHLTNVKEVQETEVVVDTADKSVLTQEFAAMSLSLSNNIDFSFYHLSDSTILPTKENVSPVAFTTLSGHFNIALDSACTNHIIRDCNLFHTYDINGTVPVKTANCGFPTTLAIGDVKFQIVINGTKVI